METIRLAENVKLKVEIFASMRDILEIAEELVLSTVLCDNCLGRQFGNLGTGTDNKERGRALKTVLILRASAQTLEGDDRGNKLLSCISRADSSEFLLRTLQKHVIEPPKAIEKCSVCKGRLQEVGAIAQTAYKLVKRLEFSTFLVGVRLPNSLMEEEDALRSRFEISTGETIKSEFSREIGKAFSAISQKPVDHRNPDITITITPFDNRIEIQINPLFVGGRYQKLVPGIPQSKWLCRKCNGKGCRACDGTGKKYPESVQEIIAKPLLKATKGTDSIIHAAGREDVDARVLGSGRPFIIEIKNPKRRKLNLAAIAREVNQTSKVKVRELSQVQKDNIKQLKSGEASEKVYKVVVEVDSEISPKDLRSLRKTLTQITVRQLTPTRVLHRRADKVRERYIYEAKIRRRTPNAFEMQIRCQGGLYVKELVTGDQGRTTPNISELLNTRAKCTELTVIDIKGVDAI